MFIIFLYTIAKIFRAKIEEEYMFIICMGEIVLIDWWVILIILIHTLNIE